MEKESVFYRFSYLVHLLQTHFLFLLVHTVLIQIFDQFPSESYILRDLFVVFFAVVCQANLIGHANTFEIFYEVAEVDIPSDEIAICIKTSQLFSFVVEITPDQGNRCPEGL